MFGCLNRKVIYNPPYFENELIDRNPSKRKVSTEKREADPSRSD
jgi:hypothetical protein